MVSDVLSLGHPGPVPGPVT